MATLGVFPDGDALAFTRLQDMIGLTPGNLITHLRKLEEADYLTSSRSTVSISSGTGLLHSARAFCASSAGASATVSGPLRC
jgi:hypothetical protein